MTRTVCASGVSTRKNVKKVRLARRGESVIHDGAIGKGDIPGGKGLPIVPTDVLPKQKQHLGLRQELFGLREGRPGLQLRPLRKKALDLAQEVLRIADDRQFKRGSRLDPFADDV